MEHWDTSYDHISTKIGLFDLANAKFVKINKVFIDRIRTGWENPMMYQVITNDLDVGDFIRGTMGSRDCPFTLLIIKKVNTLVVGQVSVAYAEESSSNSLYNLLDLTDSSTFEWHPRCRHEFMSRRFFDVLGFDVNQLTFEETNKQRYLDREEVDYVEKTNSSLIPVSWESMVYGEDKKKAEEEFRRHIESRGKYPYNVKVRYVHKDGHLVNVLTRANVVEWLDDGSPWRVIGSHTDITKLTNYDAILAKYKFVSRMSHELRTPLAVIISTADTLDLDVSNIGENVQILKRSSRQLLRISNNVLSLSQLENRQAIPVTYIKVNLSDEIRALISDIRDTSAPGYKIRIIEDADVPSPVYCDVGKIRQIITNLLANAIKFSPSKGVIDVVVDVDSITDLDAEITISIRDRGVGIHTSKWNSIFREFEQGSNSIEGAGLGLYISKCLAEIISGTVRVVSSEIDKGTTMEFKFKAKLDHEQNIETENVTYIKSQYLCSAVFNKILIVDDIEMMRHVLSKQMERTAQCKNIIYATNGLEALDIVIQNDGEFDVIFMDCLMPIMDGFSSAKKILEWASANGKHDIPIVAVTASISENIHTECIEAGMYYCLFKPFTSSDIMNIVKKLSYRAINGNGSGDVAIDREREIRSSSMIAVEDDEL